MKCVEKLSAVSRTATLEIPADGSLAGGNQPFGPTELHQGAQHSSEKHFLYALPASRNVLEYRELGQAQSDAWFAEHITPILAAERRRAVPWCERDLAGLGRR